MDERVALAGAEEGEQSALLDEADGLIRADQTEDEHVGVGTDGEQLLCLVARGDGKEARAEGIQLGTDHGCAKSVSVGLEDAEDRRSADQLFGAQIVAAERVEIDFRPAAGNRFGMRHGKTPSGVLLLWKTFPGKGFLQQRRTGFRFGRPSTFTGIRAGKSLPWEGCSSRDHRSRGGRGCCRWGNGQGAALDPLRGRRPLRTPFAAAFLPLSGGKREQSEAWRLCADDCGVKGRTFAVLPGRLKALPQGRRAVAIKRGSSWLSALPTRRGSSWVRAQPAAR